MNHRTQALEAFADEDYEQASTLFTKAIQEEPGSADLLIRRAACHVKLGKDLEAVTDSNRAIESDPQNYRGYLVKGEALLSLDEYETALVALQKAEALGAPKSRCKPLIDLCTMELDREAVDQPEKSKSVGAVETPGQAHPETKSHATGRANDHAADGHASVPAASPARQTEQSTNSTSPAESSSEPLYRHQFFQTQTKVEVAVLAKNLTADQVTVEIEETRLLVVIKASRGSKEFKLDIPLAGKVVPSQSKYEILRTKLEIVLQKVDPLQWPQLEASNSQASLQTQSGHHQPYAFKGQPKDWDRMEAELKKEEKEEKLDGDAGLQKFFQGIYGGADDNTRRAMNKSFQESNGTVLSTDWKEIGSKKTEYRGPSS